MTGGKQKLNGELITGMAFVFLAVLFIWAGLSNPVWSVILLADYVILAIGIGFIVIGSITIGRSNRAKSRSQEHSGHY